MTTQKRRSCDFQNADAITNYVLNRASYRAQRLAIQLGLTDDQRDDYAHEMVLDVFTAIKKYDPAQSNPKTFINRVLDMFIKNAIRTEIHQRRREYNNPIALDHLCEGFMPVDNDPRQGELSEVEQLDMRMDFEGILFQMPQHLQHVCVLLMDYSIPDVSKKLGMHRTTIYRHITVIRKYFSDAGYEFPKFRATNLA